MKDTYAKNQKESLPFDTKYPDCHPHYKTIDHMEMDWCKDDKECRRKVHDSICERQYEHEIMTANMRGDALPNNPMLEKSPIGRYWKLWAEHDKQYGYHSPGQMRGISAGVLDLKAKKFNVDGPGNAASFEKVMSLNVDGEFSAGPDAFVRAGDIMFISAKSFVCYKAHFKAPHMYFPPMSTVKEHDCSFDGKVYYADDTNLCKDMGQLAPEHHDYAKQWCAHLDEISS